MPSPFEHPAHGAPHRPAEEPAAERGLDRRAHERRNWAARSLTSLILFGIVLLVVVVGWRDQRVRARQVDSLGAYVRVLNDQLRDGQHLPAVFRPMLDPPPPEPIDEFKYCTDSLRIFAQQREEPTIILWNATPIAMALGADGRAVGIYDHGRVRVEWMREGEFSQRKAAQDDELERLIRDSKEH